ncbi:hypothetical protein [Sphingomonas sp. 35-24ZXX]|uniref:hypothetical protein n=1 Tax=Sphingomonas sp. 35-24ZXX TaxID=1545915 RepID=UPI001E3B1A32|nr:hypothetical protein [Sphingomonas sp. 35-24ZXX]
MAYRLGINAERSVFGDAAGGKIDVLGHIADAALPRLAIGLRNRGEAAATAEARRWMLFIAGRAALAVLALGVVGLVVLRTGHWIGQGQKA